MEGRSSKADARPVRTNADRLQTLLAELADEQEQRSARLRSELQKARQRADEAEAARDALLRSRSYRLAKALGKFSAIPAKLRHLLTPASDAKKTAKSGSSTARKPGHWEGHAATADTLAISYCFLPFIEAAAITMAKRIELMDGGVDVIFNSMDAPRDPHLAEIFAKNVRHARQMTAPVKFGRWPAVSAFCDQAEAEIVRLEEAHGPYRRLYSRSMWPASHFAAAAYRLKRPEISWVAEFSDPLQRDTMGNERNRKLDRAWLARQGVYGELDRRGFEIPLTDDLFFWCEALPVILADRLIFTNDNQLAYTLAYQSFEPLRALITEKAEISPHPVLPQDYYRLGKPTHKIDPTRLNIAYFGSFYPNRSLDDVLKAMADLPAAQKESNRLHVFTNQPDVLRASPSFQAVEEMVVVAPYVGFLDHLALTTRFDYLLVNDNKLSHRGVVNPYRPSKLSDYIGSGTPIWAIIEPGSPLDSESLPADSLRSMIDRPGSILEALLAMRKRT